MTILLGLTIVLFVGLLVKLEHDHRLERADLYQRIQAPEMAVVTHATNGASSVPAAGFDDDSDYWATKDVIHADA